MNRLDPFYPIVPDLAWLARLVGQGVRLIQLRSKDAAAGRIGTDIAQAIALCATHDCQLVVNDYWREALQVGASFVHLGQEDLAGADLAAIKAAGVRLGVSTHSPAELATALHTKQSNISRIERGAQNMTIGMLGKIAKALHCRLKIQIRHA